MTGVGTPAIGDDHRSICAGLVDLEDGTVLEFVTYGNSFSSPPWRPVTTTRCPRCTRSVPIRRPCLHVAGVLPSTAKSRQRVKTQLLSQRPIAGVGNIYADEALWRAQVHRPAGE